MNSASSEGMAGNWDNTVGETLGDVSGFLYDTYMLDQSLSTDLYPGWDPGVYVQAKVYKSGESISMMDDACSYSNVDFNDGGAVFDKMIIYDWNFDTNLPGTPGSPGNSVVVLVYLKPEHNMFGVEMLGAPNPNYINILNYEVKLFGSALPISGFNAVPTQTGNWALTIESENQGGENVGYNIIAQDLYGMYPGPTNTWNNSGNWGNGWWPYYTIIESDNNFSLLSSSSWLGNSLYNPINHTESTSDFTYDTISFIACNGLTNAIDGMGWSSGSTFAPTSGTNFWWSPETQALNPSLEWMQYGYCQPALFWIVPREGYVISRHNLTIQSTTEGTPTTHINPYTQMEFTGNSNRNAGYNKFIGPRSVYGGGFPIPNASLEYNQTGDLSPNQMEIANLPGSFQALSTSQYELPTSEIPIDDNGNPIQMWSWRGVTKYNNVKAYTIDSNGEEGQVNLNSIIDPTTNISGFEEDLEQTEIMLVDTKAYTQGLPVFNQFISSVPSTWVSHNKFAGYDHGAEWIDNQMPEEYCPSDWIGNSVLVIIKGLPSYVPGLEPPNIKIKIQGRATALDGSECANFDIDFSTSDDSSIDNG